ncbi:glycoside hydrolase family 17 protein [Spirosoma pollinicola]|nr:hypothetical protein [Spirosoma pollinicola]
MIFGIYPGGVAGAPGNTGTVADFAVGKADNPIQIRRALAQLQGSTSLFIIRSYVHYIGQGIIEVSSSIVDQLDQYRGPCQQVDLVVGYHADSYVKQDWQQGLSQLFDQYGPLLHSLQIAEEPNLYHFPGDGVFPQISQVIVDGVKWAKQEALKRNLTVKIGFNTLPSFAETDPFWNSLKELVDASFLASLDYVGLDFFPDVFRPVAEDGQPMDLRQSVQAVLTHLRESTLKKANIPFNVPIHIAEHGWATGPDRSYERQAQVLEIVIRSIYELRQTLHITHYELFALRDADSSNPGLFHQFGLLRDDYSPKPGFLTYQRLINEFG